MLKYKGLPQRASLVYYGAMDSRFKRLKPAFCALLFILPFFAAFAGGKQQAHNLLWIPETTYQTGNQQASRAETVLYAFQTAYPDRVGKVEFLDGDWTIEVYGERFYYAEGRLLPASLRSRMNEYNPHAFYNYVRELPPWKPYSGEESARLREREEQLNKNPVKRSPHFFDALWRTRSRDEAWEHIKQIRFLGHPIQVHYSILTQLSLIEEQILRLSKTNAAVKQWVSSLKNLESWNWRNIAASETRSYHAYGAAIDLLPKSLGGRETYWLWTANHTPEWWNVPYTWRFHPPDDVIKAFESFGFVWGGKWLFYDTMHFEYRPEILVLSGIERMDPRDLR